MINTREIVRELSGFLGSALVSELAGFNDSRLPFLWVLPNGPSLPGEVSDRLRIAYKALVLVYSMGNPIAARNWFIIDNPLLDNVSPVTALRVGDTERVYRAAVSFTDSPQ